MSADLLALVDAPAAAGRRAAAARDELFGASVLLRTAPRHGRPEVAAVLRGGDVMTCDAWPEPETWRAGDRVIVQVDARDPGQRSAYVTYLERVVAHAPAGCSLAPFSAAPSGLGPLWCVAVARLALPASVRVEVRHDLVGIRLAQVALGFGGDTLAGPVVPGRPLPIAGVPRPDEPTPEGLANLVRQVGLAPQPDPEHFP